MRGQGEFEVQIVGDWALVDETDDNVDVYVTLADGRKYVATFFTPRNVERLMGEFGQSGECGFGSYFWAADMILISSLSRVSVRNAVRDLMSHHEFESAFRGPL